MENSTLVKPVLVPINIDKNFNKLSENLSLSQEDWDALNAERKAVFDIYKTPFIEGALENLDKPNFTKAEVMKTIQETMSQQGILLLAAEAIVNILQEALNAAKEIPKLNPFEELLKKLMQEGPQRLGSSDDEQPKGE